MKILSVLLSFAAIGCSGSQKPPTPPKFVNNQSKGLYSTPIGQEGPSSSISNLKSSRSSPHSQNIEASNDSSTLASVLEDLHLGESIKPSTHLDNSLQSPTAQKFPIADSSPIKRRQVRRVKYHPYKRVGKKRQKNVQNMSSNQSLPIYTRHRPKFALANPPEDKTESMEIKRIDISRILFLFPSEKQEILRCLEQNVNSALNYTTFYELKEAQLIQIIKPISTGASYYPSNLNMRSFKKGNKASVVDIENLIELFPPQKFPNNSYVQASSSGQHYNPAQPRRPLKHFTRKVGSSHINTFGFNEFPLDSLNLIHFTLKKDIQEISNSKLKEFVPENSLGDNHILFSSLSSQTSYFELAKIMLLQRSLIEAESAVYGIEASDYEASWLRKDWNPQTTSVPKKERLSTVYGFNVSLYAQVYILTVLMVAVFDSEPKLDLKCKEALIKEIKKWFLDNVLSFHLFIAKHARDESGLFENNDLFLTCYRDALKKLE